MNEELEQIAENNKLRHNKIGVLLLGNNAPGGNNIIDGLLRYANHNKRTSLFGFVNGIAGVKSDTLLDITEESFAPYRNLGGYDYLGRSKAMLDPSQFQMLAESCKKNGITGLILVGATHTLTIAAKLNEYFMASNIEANIVVIPATFNGNVKHKYFQCALGFDTVSKVYSQLIGNMLTDSASSTKHWYFVRLMGKDPSHLALECALQTHPNMTIISEECAFRGETLPDII